MKVMERQVHAYLERRLPGLYPPIKLPTTQEKEGIVIEDPRNGPGSMILPESEENKNKGEWADPKPGITIEDPRDEQHQAELAGPRGVRRYEVSTKRDLDNRAKPRDGLQHDHQPSHAANVLAKEAELGRELTPEENRELYNNGTAVAVPQSWHEQESETYGGRNTTERQERDAANRARAARENSKAMVEGASPKDKAAAEAAAAEVRRRAKDPL
jgi:hypothetical protein